MAIQSSFLAWRIPMDRESRVGSSPWRPKEWDTAERLSPARMGCRPVGVSLDYTPSPPFLSILPCLLLHICSCGRSCLLIFQVILINSFSVYSCNFGVPMGCLGGSDSKESTCNGGDLHSIPGLGRSPEEGNGYPLQYPCLENFMDRGAWQATVTAQHSTAPYN